MTAIHRREMLGVMLGGAVVATAGLALMPVPAESAPLMISKSRPATTDNLVEEAVLRRAPPPLVAPPPQGVLVAPGTSSVPLALDLNAQPVGGD